MKIEMDYNTHKTLLILIVWIGAALLSYLSPNVAGGAIIAATVITLLTSI